MLLRSRGSPVNNEGEGTGRSIEPMTSGNPRTIDLLKRYKSVLAAMLGVGVAFGVAIPLGFWLHVRFPSLPDEMLAGTVVVVIFAVAFSVTRLVNGPFRRRRMSMIVYAGYPTATANVKTGYEMTFDEFRQLVSTPSSQPNVAPLLREWFGYEIRGSGNATAIYSSTGASIPLSEAHGQIQGDQIMQYTVYQRAMDIWR